MGRKCKCTICKAELNTDTAYTWIHYPDKPGSKPKKFYYCSESEYLNYIIKKNKEKSDKIKINEVINNIIGYENKNTLLFAQERKWISIPDAIEVIENHSELISKILSDKGFTYDAIHIDYSSQYRFIKYLSAVINNNLEVWISDLNHERELQEFRESKPTPEHDEYKAKSFQRRKRKCLDDYDEE